MDVLYTNERRKEQYEKRRKALDRDVFQHETEPLIRMVKAHAATPDPLIPPERKDVVDVEYTDIPTIKSAVDAEETAENKGFEMAFAGVSLAVMAIFIVLGIVGLLSGDISNGALGLVFSICTFVSVTKIYKVDCNTDEFKEEFMW